MRQTKKEVPEKKGKSDNLAGILITVISVMLLFLFLFGVSVEKYRLLAIAIPVVVFTVALLLISAFLGFEMSKRMY